MKYNLTQSAEIAQVSRKTFRKHVVSKGISVEVDDNGNKWVDASELIRVYGSDVCKFPEEGDDKLPIKKSAKTEVPIQRCGRDGSHKTGDGISERKTGRNERAFGKRANSP